METFLYVLGIIFCVLICAFGGWLFALYRIARDETLVRIMPDEQLIKRPADGYVLVAVTSEMARNITLNAANKDSNSQRGIMQKTISNQK